MLLLAFDTSGKQGSLALAQYQPGAEARVLEVVPVAGGTFSAQLVPQVAAVLERHGHGKQEVSAIAAIHGPGSFTGLRVGLAAVKGLAEILSVPVVAVSALELLAWKAKADGPVLAVLDAGRGQFFAGEYVAAAGRLNCVAESLLTAEELSATAAGVPRVVCEDSVAHVVAASGSQLLRIERPTAGDLAVFAVGKLERGETVSVEALDANYIRRSDAELFSLPKLP